MSVSTQTLSDHMRTDVRWDVFDALCAAKGWVTDLNISRGLGFPSHSTLSRLRAGKITVSRLFIERAMTALDVPYEAIFVRRSSDDA